MRSGAFGVNSISGLRRRACTCRRSRWKYCAAVVALHTWMLSSAHSEEALDPRRRVLRPLALVTVGQQQHEAVASAPTCPRRRRRTGR